MPKQPVNIQPFLYHYLNTHHTYGALGEFLLDLYAGVARAGGMYRSFSWDEVESIIQDFTDEDLQYFQSILSRLFATKDVIGLEEIEHIFEFYAVELLKLDLDKRESQNIKFAMM